MSKPATSKHPANGGGRRPNLSVVVGGARRKPLVPAKKAAPASNGSNASRDRRLRFAELLLSISQKMSGMETLDEVLNGLVEVTTKELIAERGTLFLNDPETNELYSRVAQGTYHREIRLLNNTGIAGHVFTTGEGLIIDDAYADARFNRTIDEQTGFVTRSILCVPIKTAKGDIIGVAQVLNKQKGNFTRGDLKLLVAMTTQGTLALQSAQFIERMKAIRKQELEFLDIVSEVTSDIKIGSLLQKVMGEATRMLNAERSTLFLNDDKTNELWSEVGQGLESMQIRLPNHVGIAGAVFQSAKTINIPYAYADLRFNPGFDKQTGYFTRSILCVPIVNQRGRIIGVTQVLNKRGGPFTNEDESRLKAFTAQISIALENAKLFADVQNMKNYNESMLESMSSGVLTLDETEKIVTCNAAGLRILHVAAAACHQPVGAGVFRRCQRVADRQAEKGRGNPAARAYDGRGDGARGRAPLRQRHDNAACQRRAEAAGLDDADRGHLEREAHEDDEVALHGPVDRRSTDGGGRRRARRQKRHGDGAVLGHPRFHHADRRARPACDSVDAQ